MSWYSHYWYVIGDIIKSNKPNEQKINDLKCIGEYIPCGVCKTHFFGYITKNSEIQVNNQWLINLKNEINLNKQRKDIQPKKQVKRCCGYINITKKTSNFKRLGQLGAI